jgi:hypothetical protein
MSRPDFVTDEDISRWNTHMNDNPQLPQLLISNPTIREVCYAGEWLSEELDKLDCPEEFLNRILFTAGKLSFGRDPWEIHQQMLNSYNLNELDYETEPSELN